MKHSLRNLLAGLAGAATLLLAACGGGGDGGGGSTATPPTAVARADQASVAIGSTVTLDGSASSTPNGGSLGYEWTLAARPDGSAAALANPTTAKPTFVPDRPGNYVAALVVKDARTSSAAARVTVAATNPDPLALITPASQGVLLGSSVTLDGSASLAPTGADAAGLSYQWRLIEQPAGVATALRSSTSAKANFTADKIGIYRATLVVGHGAKLSAAAQATITVSTTNSAPVIGLSVPATAVRGQAVVLDASTSQDPDGTPLHYRWNFARELANAIPYGSSATISNASSARASFVPDSGGSYVVDLTIYDGSVSTTQRSTIQVAKPEGAANTAPVARIGSAIYQDVDAIEYETGAWVTPGGSTSYDIDGDTLTYRWTWWNTATPAIRETASGSALNLGRGLPAGSYQAELVVNDGQADSAVATRRFVIKTGANLPPVGRVAVASAKVLRGETMEFDGSGSTDANGDRLEYRWTLIDRPDGSNAVLQNAASAKPHVVADQPGLYTARLQLRDSGGLLSSIWSAAAHGSVFAKAQNNPPVIAKLSLYGDLPFEPAADQPVIMKDNRGFMNFTLQAFDPDQDTPLYFQVAATRQPAGTAALTSVANRIVNTALVTGGAMGAITAAGDYEIEALVSDGVATADARRASVRFVERADFPSLLLESTNPEADQDSLSFQQYFPFVQYDAVVMTGTQFNFNSRVWYRLTAFDRDYTITGLQTSAAMAGYQPRFKGLVNGQVIRKGESVVLELERPRIVDEAALAERYLALAAESSNSTEARAAFDNEAARQKALLASYGFTWSFRVAERDDFTFYIGPK